MPTPDLGQDPHPYVLFELFNTVLHLLGGLPSLEEVEIYNLPTCDHAEEFPRGIRPSYDICWPTGTRLGNVKALALNLRCEACRGIGASVALLDNLPHLTSLKISGDGTDFTGYHFLGAFPPYDQSAFSRLTRLFVRSRWVHSTDSAMERIHTHCPGIMEVDLTPFYEGCFNISYYFDKTYDFRVKRDKNNQLTFYNVSTRYRTLSYMCRAYTR